MSTYPLKSNLEAHQGSPVPRVNPETSDLPFPPQFYPRKISSYSPVRLASKNFSRRGRQVQGDILAATYVQKAWRWDEKGVLPSADDDKGYDKSFLNG